MAIEHTLSTNVIVSNLKETISTPTILAETPNVNPSIQSIGTPSQTKITVFQIPDRFPANSQRIDFVVSDSSSTSSDGKDALSNMTSMDIDEILTEVRKNKQKEYISYI